MKHVFVLRIILIAACCLAAASATAQPDLKQLDAVLAGYNKAGAFNGVLMVAKGDDIIYQGAVGKAVIEWNIPNTADTRFRIGSVTKQFTAALILMLAEDGLIDLQVPIGAYFPAYPKEQAGKITVHHLLTHTSGIPSYTNRPDFVTTIMRTHYETDAFIKLFSDLPLEFEPGSSYRYSNSGYALLGAIIEKLTGKPYATVLRERIIKPLGLNATGYENNNDIIPNMANGYQRIPGAYERAPMLDTSVPYSAGMLYSTTSDLLKWTRALHSGRVFKKKETLQTMITPVRNNYGYGLAMTTETSGERSIKKIQHSGGINGFSSQLWYMPEKEYTIAALDNTTSNSGIAAEAAFAVLYGMDIPKARFPIAEEVAAVIESDGIEAAVSRYHELKKQNTTDYDFAEQQLNGLGYLYIGRGDLSTATRILALNLEMFPEAFNAWDSMGEAYMKSGDNERAITHYRKALELNPGSANAKAMLEKLGVQVEVKDLVLSEAALDRYVGRYELQPGFILSVTREGTQLSMQATNQSKVEVYPSSETKFYLKVVDAQVEFIANAEGVVDQLILHQGGRDMPARRMP